MCLYRQYTVIFKRLFMNNKRAKDGDDRDKRRTAKKPPVSLAESRALLHNLSRSPLTRSLLSLFLLERDKRIATCNLRANILYYIRVSSIAIVGVRACAIFTKQLLL